MSAPESVVSGRLTGVRRVATATAVTDLRVLEIPRQALESLFTRSPDRMGIGLGGTFLRALRGPAATHITAMRSAPPA